MPRSLLVLLAGLALLPQLANAAESPSTDAKAIFDGQSLDGWSGNEAFWRVEDGAIVAESTPERPCKQNSFLVWDRGTVDDFELTLRFRITGHETANSGVQYRSTITDGHAAGYQADIDSAGRYRGCLYDERGRGMLAEPGQTVLLKSGEKPAVQATAEAAPFNADGWNDYRILARGMHLQHFVNGTLTADVTDHDMAANDASGQLALQLHSGPACKVEFRDIRLKRLPLSGDRKKVVFIGGKPSHKAGAHEFNAGSHLLADALNASLEETLAVVYENGWPSDPTALDNADTIVCGFNGGDASPLPKHAGAVDAALARGAGFIAWHYATEVPESFGDHMRGWLGGAFEQHYSVNPWWTPEGATLADHPITRGVDSIEVRDEWYYHLRFADEGVTPIVTALPPRETLDREDGPHSNNPAVRADVLESEQPQTIAWAYDRTDGGRSFGFTGGHVHANWQADGFRTLMLNAIVWTAGLDVPALGVPSATPDDEQIAARQDQPSEVTRRQQPAKTTQPGRVAAESDLLTESRRRQTLTADVSGAGEVSLLVDPDGEGLHDWLAWSQPTLTMADGSTQSLLGMDWTTATSGWGEVKKNHDVEGRPLTADGQPVEGIGTHAPSVVTFRLPPGAKSLSTEAVLTNPGGAVRALIVAGDAAQFVAAIAGTESADAFSRDPQDAVAGLDTIDGLQTRLMASEPMLYSPSNIDVDHLGRIWVCEIVNYRHFRNKDNPVRESGDRILVLQDTDGDGVCDRKTVFYQGTDIDSPHGVCVLGDRVIVSAGEHVFSLVDTDGDLKADRRDVLFSGIDGVQHDHGIHSFLFGPDGKLYFNFGNEGKQLRDRDGNLIVDRSGEEVVEDLQPYQMGMVFRCDLDGANVETLGWNFRNNWETAIDSFGTLWQSDNDDDGNRGTRMNFVMEYGNYGYRDEVTGAGWRDPRTGWEDTIPERHWHLNDPGVVPNLFQTGAGSPTGIMVYEGELLPEPYRGEIIHCDAGPNMVRAFPVRPDGAGYTATLEPIVTGERDRWFRPSDVTAAPDGSLIIADWYDPGVGGHAQGDVVRGRIFRTAPAGSDRYQMPTLDLTTVDGAIAALRNPNLSARYLGFTTLRRMASDGNAQPAEALAAMTSDANARMAARAFFCLDAIERDAGTESPTYAQAIGSDNPNLRIVGLRILRARGKAGIEEVTADRLLTFANDNDAAVRRECCIALAEVGDEVAVAVWPTLAMQYDGADRWYLEALGIAARGRWDACLSALEQQTAMPVSDDASVSATTPKLDAKAYRDLVWRSRATRTPELLAKLIADPATPAAELPRLLRSFDFQPASDAKNDALASLAFGPDVGDEATATMVRTEALDRLESVDFDARPDYRDALGQVLDASRGTDGYLALVKKFNLADRSEQLLADAIADPTSAFAGDAIGYLAKQRRWDLLKGGLADPQQVLPLIRAMRRSGASQTAGLLSDVMGDQSRPLTVRRAAVDALARSSRGAELLVTSQEDGSLPPALLESASAAMQSVSYGHLDDRIAAAFPAPGGKDGDPTPPIPELVGMGGDFKRGRLAFNSVGTCSKCHIVDSIGQEVGPNLSEIGDKLSREAMFEAILYPSAGVSHNYETYLVLTIDGDVITGLMVSETDDELTLRTVDARNRTIARDDIDVMKKQDTSLMPAGLQKILSTQELVDVVDYMQTLRKKK